MWALRGLCHTPCPRSSCALAKLGECQVAGGGTVPGQAWVCTFARQAALVCTVVWEFGSRRGAALTLDVHVPPPVPQVFAIGNPFGLDHTLTSGIISGLNRELNTGKTPTRIRFCYSDGAVGRVLAPQASARLCTQRLALQAARRPHLCAAGLPAFRLPVTVALCRWLRACTVLSCACPLPPPPPVGPRRVWRQQPAQRHPVRRRHQPGQLRGTPAGLARWGGRRFTAPHPPPAPSR